MLVVDGKDFALRSEGGGGLARNRRLGTRRCSGTAATGARAREAGVATVLAVFLLALMTLAAFAADEARLPMLLQSDAILRVLAVSVLILSTTWLLFISRRDWMRLAESERRAPGLLTSLGLDPRGAHADISKNSRRQSSRNLETPVEHRGETGGR